MPRSVLSSERVELSGLEWLTHYYPVLFAILAGTGGVILLFVEGQREGGILGLFLPVAGLLIWLQRRALRYHVVRTHRSPAQNYRLVLSVLERRGWKIGRREDARMLQACVTGAFPRSWGERVTAVFRGSDVLLNSICDPGRKSSACSTGRNAENLRVLVEVLTPSRGPESLST